MQNTHHLVPTCCQLGILTAHMLIGHVLLDILLKLAVLTHEDFVSSVLDDIVQRLAEHFADSSLGQPVLEEVLDASSGDILAHAKGIPHVVNGDSLGSGFSEECRSEDAQQLHIVRSTVFLRFGNRICCSREGHRSSRHKLIEHIRSDTAEKRAEGQHIHHAVATVGDDLLEA